MPVTVSPPVTTVLHCLHWSVFKTNWRPMAAGNWSSGSKWFCPVCNWNQIRTSQPCPVVSNAGCCWPGPWSESRSCCCWMSRLIIWILMRSVGWRGDYRNYLRHKQQLLDAETKQQAQFDRELAREEAWIRQGIKARRTRNEGGG